MLTRRACTAVFFLASVSIIVAQEQLPARDPLAVNIVMQSLSAMGAPGGSSLPAADSVMTAEVIPLRGQPHTIVIQTKGAGHVRFDSSVDGVATTYTAAGEVGRDKKGSAARALPVTVASARSRPEHIPVLLIAGEFLRGDASVLYLGQETIDGRTNHRIAFRRTYQRTAYLKQALEKATAFEIVIDANDLTVSELRYDAPSETDWRLSSPVKVQYRNYTSIQGLRVPMEVSEFFYDVRLWTMQVRTAVFNQGIPDATFDVR